MSHRIASSHAAASDVRDWFRRWGWLPGGAVLGIVLVTVVEPMLRAIDVSPRWITVVGVVGLLPCFRILARQDPIGFLSIAVPAVLVAVAGLLVPGSLGLALGLVGILIVGAFILAPYRVWPHWSRLVLRRPPLPHWWAFERMLRAHIHDQQGWLRKDERADGSSRKATLRDAARATARLRRLRAPDGPWAELRDALAEYEEAWVRWHRTGSGEASDLAERAAELKARYAALRRSSE